MTNDLLVGETKRGFDLLKEVFERGRILQVGVPKVLGSNDGNYYSILVRGPASTWELCLSRENLNDLPGTSEHGVAAIALVKVLESRLQTPDPYVFLTATGRALRIKPIWPYRVSVGEVDHSVLIDVADEETRQATKCVGISRRWHEYQTNPYQRIESLFNSVRLTFDSGNLELTPKTPPEEIEIMGGRAAPQTISANTFVQAKVWMLGHVVAPSPQARVWIADSWDVSYFKIPTQDMIRRGFILNAQEKITLVSDETEFARVGPKMLAQEGPDREAPPAAAPPSEEFRTALETYTRLDILGEGGAGRVLRVKDADGSEFALKYLKAESATTAKSKRFKNEMWFSSCPRNPHIIRVIDWGLAVVNGVEVPFYVMPLYSMTLMDVIRKKFGPDALLDIFDQILDGMQAAHEQGVFHRDLKPQNILYDPNTKTAVISDFGIAHFAETLLHTEVQTGRQDRQGNFRYAAPEQRSGGKVDHRADTYALGMILYEMFTGNILQGTGHVPIDASHPDYAFLDPIVNKMAAQASKSRYQSIAEVTAAIKAGRAEPRE